MHGQLRRKGEERTGEEIKVKDSIGKERKVEDRKEKGRRGKKSKG
jgi:hypothetical protein